MWTLSTKQEKKNMMGCLKDSFFSQIYSFLVRSSMWHTSRCLPRFSCLIIAVGNILKYLFHNQKVFKAQVLLMYSNRDATSLDFYFILIFKQNTAFKYCKRILTTKHEYGRFLLQRVEKKLHKLLYKIVCSGVNLYIFPELQEWIQTFHYMSNI